MKKILFYAALIASFTGFAQEKFPPKKIITGTNLGVSIPLRDLAQIVPLDSIPNNLRIIPNNMRNAPKSNQDALPLGADPMIQKNAPNRASQDILISFDGINVSEGQAIPPDPTGAAGPNHYVHAVNSAIKVFNKNGVLLLGPLSLAQFFQNGVNDGDPIVMYDQLADRWFISQFNDGSNGLLIAVSETADPTSTYFRYEFELDDFPDYPHYAVWPNAYYLAANKNGDVAYTIDREALLNDESDPVIIGFELTGIIRNPNTVFGPQPANLIGSMSPANDAPGYFVYLQDDSWPGVVFDHLKVWEVEPNFSNPGISTISVPQIIPTQAFESTFQPFGNGDVGQPGSAQAIDNVGGVISYMANYRAFGDYNSFLLNFNVNLGDDLSGIRWYELRNEGAQEFTIFQEGTWTLDDNVNRFMGSMTMNDNGDIALGYNVGSFSVAAGLRFTGRLDGDTLNEMSFKEQTIIDGAGIQTNTNRFGDYAQMTIDPDGETFWYVGEYFQDEDFWSTRITAFNLDDLPLLTVGTFDEEKADIQIYPLSKTEMEVVVLDVLNDGELSYDILDIKGAVVHSAFLSKTANGFKGQFDTRAISDGIFIVSIYNTAGSLSLTKKFVLKQ